MYVLARNERSNEGFRWPVRYLPFAPRLASRTEPLLQHEVPPRPWARVAADICFNSGRVLLVVVDYFSNLKEVDSLSSETSKSVIRSLMAIFSRFGVPDTLVTDNGPYFASSEFAKFADQWNFEHVTSSPRYPQSNGKADNAVRTVERLFTNATQDIGTC